MRDGRGVAFTGIRWYVISIPKSDRDRAIRQLRHLALPHFLGNTACMSVMSFSERAS